MYELAPGLWHWDAPHPEWRPGDEWEERVSSYAIDDGERLLLFDPLAVPAELEAVAADRETAIVLTCPWHERDAEALTERLGAPVLTPRPDEGSSDVAWLGNDGRWYEAGDVLPVGVEAFPGGGANNLVLWVESKGAIVAGDSLIDRGEGLEIPGGLARRGPLPRTGRRGPATAARQTRGARPRDARRPEGPHRARDRAGLKRAHDLRQSKAPLRSGRHCQAKPRLVSN